jgi:hypothetical protein
MLLAVCMLAGVVSDGSMVYAQEENDSLLQVSDEADTESYDPIRTADESETAGGTEAVTDIAQQMIIETEEEMKAAAGDEAASESDTVELPTGLLEIESIEVGEIDEEEIFDLTDVNSEEWSDFHGSAAYLSEWDSYSSNYFYNLLSEEKRALWDALDAACTQLLISTDTAEYDGGLAVYYVPFVSYGTLQKREATYVAYMFRYLNPQYYFLNTKLLTGTANGDKYMTFGVYTAFADGTARNTATRNVKAQVDAWKQIANAYATDAEKVKVLHDLIVENVEYNNAIIDSNFDEDTAYSQSAYSVFCTDLTVCAGYAQAFEMMCNAVGIDCVAVTSSSHEWNKVRIDDSWYNVDCTWADQSTWIDYEFFERNDAYYDSGSYYSVNMHTEESYWEGYLPTCSLDSGATSTNPGRLPVISSTTSAPVIAAELTEGGYLVSLSDATANAVIYYTLDGTTPSPAATKSYRYSAPFVVDSTCTLKAIAVRDTYWDSSVTSQTIEVCSTSSAFLTGKAKFVALLYENVLERYAEQFEIDSWVEELNNGKTGTEVAYGFLFSAELQNKNYNNEDYVEVLYQSLMGRASDAAGKADWVQHLSNGVSRTYVFKQFTDSDEFTNLCSDYGIRKGTQELSEARDQNYYVTSFVARNYTEFLQRSYDADGLNYWCAAINGREKTMQEIAYGFVFSQECTNKGLSNADYVEMLYRGCFDRDSDAAGKADWVSGLDSGALTREEVFYGFANSQEFANMVSSYGL